ncbi:MAG: prepilin-type N-terminal cleavage/methylation domain-containing protein [Patescibacteria group bacterium]|nr:prepilin-type N-terminal cleavage/methylation domain-containing protein [Patescibacteria group bacterium]
MKRQYLSASSRQAGFTLIELLVVIAIIGLLATIALASLNSARKKSADAAVKSNMANIAGQAELYYDGTGNGSYGASLSSCTPATGLFSDANITAMINAAKAQATFISPATAVTASCTTDSVGQKWAVLIGNLKGDSTNRNWCVDSSGNKGFTTGTATTAGVCPTVTST